QARCLVFLFSVPVSQRTIFYRVPSVFRKASAKLQPFSEPTKYSRNFFAKICDFFEKGGKK
ncbi:MAG: hypothetical protein IJ607_06625, partial [Bacteroidaceae bacterium]|nr:hypothetical protein [Bacteroidaceae bacterium]